MYIAHNSTPNRFHIGIFGRMSSLCGKAGIENGLTSELPPGATVCRKCELLLEQYKARMKAQ